MLSIDLATNRQNLFTSLISLLILCVITVVPYSVIIILIAGIEPPAFGVIRAIIAVCILLIAGLLTQLFFSTPLIPKEGLFKKILGVFLGIAATIFLGEVVLDSLLRGGFYISSSYQNIILYGIQIIIFLIIYRWSKPFAIGYIFQIIFLLIVPIATYLSNFVLKCC